MHTRMCRLIGSGILLVSILLGVTMVLSPRALQAQGETVAPDCSPEAHALILDHYAELIRVAGADVGAQITAMQADLATLDAACVGLSFTGNVAKVIGPITLPEGMYKATVTTDGYFIAKVTASEGECDSPTFGGLFNLMEGQGNGAEALLQSSGCTAYIVLSNVTKDWQLSFSKLG